MRFHDISTDNMLNGDGLRTVLWVSGCTHQCKECHNPVTWDINGGIPFDENAENELFEKLSQDYISGITFSGGDPLHPENRNEVGRLIRKIHDTMPQKTIWLYTGYDWEEIMYLDFVQYIDVLVDGEFVIELKDNKLKWRGSSNQRVIDVKKSLEINKVVLHCD